MAFPIAIGLLLAGGGAYFLFSKKKPATQAGGAAVNPVLVPSEQLPAPPGAVGPTEMPGGPPQVIVSPPSTSTTPQQQVTQALPNLVQQVQQALPQLFPQTPMPTVRPPGVPSSAVLRPDGRWQTSDGTVWDANGNVLVQGQALPPVSTPVTVAPPGQNTIPVAVPTPVTPTPVALPPAITPQVLTQQLPQVLTNVLNQATQATQSTQATPLQHAETQPALDTYGTIALAKQMIDREASSGWKSALTAEINAWEARVGVGTGGKFGEGDAKRMAQEVGVLPLVRYWPKNTLANTEVPKYRAAIEAIAQSVQASNPAHAAALRSSAAFETGRTYGTDNPAAVDPSLRQIQANALQMTLTS